MLNRNFQKLALIHLGLCSLLLSFSVSAEMIKKPALSANFNQMIEQSSEEKAALETKISTHYAADDEIDLTEDDADLQKVVDFIDVEVQFGKDRKVVDRRFNSIEEPKAEITRVPQSLPSAQQMQVTLIDQNSRN